MRSFSLALMMSCALLSACGNSLGSKKVSLPFETPQGSGRLVDAFIQICSNAMIAPEDGVATALKQGWTQEEKHRGRWQFESDLYDGVLIITHRKFPHVTSHGCFMSIFDDEGLSLATLSKIGTIPGLEGDEYRVNGSSGTNYIGEWSVIGPHGKPVIIVYEKRDAFTSITMMTEE